MSGFYRMRLASLAAIVGGLLQIGILWSQVNQLRLETALSGSSFDPHPWSWNVPWGYRWLVVSAWLFFLGALWALQWYTTRRFGQPDRKGLLGIIGILAIMIAETTVLLAIDPACSLGLRCPSQLFSGALFATTYTNPYTLAFYAGMLGTLCLCGSLLSSGFFLWCLPIARNWGLLFFFLGLLAAPSWIVISEATDAAPGFFKMDTLVMEQEFLWALAWLVVGIILWRMAATVRAFPRVSPDNTLEKTTS